MRAGSMSLCRKEAVDDDSRKAERFLHAREEFVDRAGGVQARGKISQVRRAIAA
jgi:hypothetical protein